MEKQTKSQLYLHFIPEIEYKTQSGQVLKLMILKPDQQAFCPMVWQNNDIWTSCITLSLDLDKIKSSFEFEYQYVVCGYSNLDIYRKDVIRSFDLASFKIDLSGEKTHLVLKTQDFWEFPDKSRCSLDKIALKMSRWAVLLGKSLNSDGSAKEELLARVQKLADIYKKNPDFYTKAILTGGKVKQNIISEAQLMYELCIKKGLPQDFLIMEPEAKTTMENAIFSKILAVKEGIVRLDIISSGYHLERSLKIFQRVFQIDDIYKFELVHDGADPKLDYEYLQRNIKKEKELSDTLDTHPLFANFRPICN